MEWYNHDCGLPFLVVRGKPSTIKSVRFKVAKRLLGIMKLDECPRCAGQLPGSWGLDEPTGIHTIFFSNGSHN